MAVGGWCRVGMAIAVLWPSIRSETYSPQRTRLVPRTLSTPSGFVTASVYSGDMRVTLTTRAVQRGPRSLNVQLTEGHTLLSGLPVSLRLSRQLRAFGRPYLLRPRGTSYWAVVGVPQGGDWEIYIQVRRTPSQVRRVPFLLYIGQSSFGQVWSIYPLFMPVNSWRPSISLPLGPYTADIRVSIAPFGQAQFRIELRSNTHRSQLPSRLQLVLTMRDMKMGRTLTIASPAPLPLYNAEAFFSMPGAWSIEITTGNVVASAALIVGARS